jgi:hypothetical protein
MAEKLQKSEVRTYVGPGDGHTGLDALVVERATHLAVCWTAELDGKRAVVAVEFLPRPKAGVVGLDLSEVQERATHIENLGPLKPLSSSALRDLSFSSILGLRGEMAKAMGSARESPLSLHEMRQALEANLPRDDSMERAARAILEDAVKVDYLPDAVLYVEAIRDGVSPRRRIGEERGIELQSADRRIARAREIGLLTPAKEQRRAGGQLTDLANAALTLLRHEHEEGTERG